MKWGSVLREELVSVVIPTYNRESTVLKSINSILEQTYANLECIVVDDGSTDNTEEKVLEIKDNRLRYIKLEHNSGPSIARNTGIRESRGNYIAFNDSDDLWLPDKLKMQMEKMKSEDETGMVYCCYTYDKNGKEMKIPSDRYERFQLEGYIFDSLWQDNKIGTPTILVKRECVDACGGFAENLHSLEDWEFVLRISEKYKIAYVNKILVHACYSPRGVNEQYELQAETIWHIMKCHQSTKWNDAQMVRLLFHKLAMISDKEKIAYWVDVLVPSIIASKPDFMLALGFAKERNKFLRVNKVLARMTNLEVLNGFINDNVDLEKEKIAIYGAGDVGIYLARLMNLLNISFAYIIDKNDVCVEGFDIVRQCKADDEIHKVIVTIMDAADGEVDLGLPCNVKQVNLYDIID